MAKPPHCAKTTCCSKGALRLKELEEMKRLKYFLYRRCILHAPLTDMRPYFTFSIIPFKSVNVGDHFDMHLVY